MSNESERMWKWSRPNLDPTLVSAKIDSTTQPEENFSQDSQCPQLMLLMCQHYLMMTNDCAQQMTVLFTVALVFHSRHYDECMNEQWVGLDWS